MINHFLHIIKTSYILHEDTIKEEEDISGKYTQKSSSNVNSDADFGGARTPLYFNTRTSNRRN